MPSFIEAPTTFYLGRRYDPDTERLTNDVAYYDSRDLTTHAVVVGMTGSGKTGLCINLLEEATLEFADNVVENSRLSCQIKVTDALDGLRLKMPESQR